MWRVLGTITPKTLHVARIHHTIRHSLNAGTYRHTRRHTYGELRINGNFGLGAGVAREKPWRG
jgi:hypothetical protein